MSNSAMLQAVPHQAPLSMGFSRQEYWRWLPFPSAGDLPDPEIKSVSFMVPCWQAGSLSLHRLCMLCFLKKILFLCLLLNPPVVPQFFFLNKSIPSICMKPILSKQMPSLRCLSHSLPDLPRLFAFLKRTLLHLNKPLLV